MSQENEQEGSDGTQVTMDQMEASIEKEKVEAAKPDLSTIKLEIEGLPDALKGKSVLEVVEHTKRLEDALKLSEKARAEAAEGPRTVYVERQPEQQMQQGPVKLTREQVKELYDNDPLSAFEYMQGQSAAMIQANIEARTGPLRNGIATAAEAQAKQRYADDFQLLGKEINDIVNKLPDKGALAMPGAWDDIVNYVRGQNIDKVIEFRTNRKDTADREAAQRIAQQAAPLGSLAAQRSPSPVAVTGVLDPTRKEIAKVLGLTEDEYIKWSQVGV